MLKDKEVSKLFEDCYIEDDWIYANDGQFIVYQWAETTWHSSNRKRYLESGYIRESKSSKELVVDVRDLSLNSGVKVLRRCPICKIEIERGWQTLMRNGATFCISCSNKQRAYSIEELNEIISKIDGQRLEVTSDVIYRDETNIDYHMTYRDCLCDCGNTTNVSISSLMGDILDLVDVSRLNLKH